LAILAIVDNCPAPRTSAARRQRSSTRQALAISVELAQLAFEQFELFPFSLRHRFSPITNSRIGGSSSTWLGMPLSR
jgi:hypothetical protein